MRYPFIIVLLLFTGICLAQDYDLPEVIAHLHAEEPYFATDFCWVGDQNDDGFDDILITHESTHNAKLFFGSRDGVDNEPNFVFEPYLENQDKYFRVNYLGNLIPNHEPFIVLNSLQRSDPIRILLDFQEGGEELDDNPEYSIARDHRENDIYVTEGFRMRPADLNGDGFDDLIAYDRGDSLGRFLIYFGGDDFDTIPDWTVHVNLPNSTMGSTDYSTGNDVNKDGYNDLLLRVHQSPRQSFYWYSLYLGGAPMDTVPVFSFREDHFEGAHTNIKMQKGFTILSDVNADGYDDWGIFWTERTVVNERPYVDNGFRIFFGGEEPNIDDYIDLEAHPNFWFDRGELTGGDFNDDGFGDIVTCIYNDNFGYNEVGIHFGPDWEGGEPEIFVDLYRDYEGIYVGRYITGATGDYNGDGADDIPLASVGRIIIMAGNSDWEAGVDLDQQPIDYSLSLEAHPNPFNDYQNITFDLPIYGSVDLNIYNVLGQVIHSDSLGQMQQGKHSTLLTGEDLSAGIYFISISVRSNSRYMSEIAKTVYLP